MDIDSLISEIESKDAQAQGDLASKVAKKKGKKKANPQPESEGLENSKTGASEVSGCANTSCTNTGESMDEDFDFESELQQFSNRISKQDSQREEKLKPNVDSAWISRLKQELEGL
jgi:hypothetical protein